MTDLVRVYKTASGRSTASRAVVVTRAGRAGHARVAYLSLRLRRGRPLAESRQSRRQAPEVCSSRRKR